MNESSTIDTKSEPPTTSSSSFVPGGHLYTDFSSDSIPTPVQPVQTTMVETGQTTKETEGKEEKSSGEQPKRPNRKDWIDTENPFHCKPCDFIAQNIEEFQDHSLSYRHIKKTAEVLEMKVNTKKEEEKKKPTSFTCEICVCSCNSESAWNMHLVGQKHRKNLEKQGAAKQFQKQKMKYGTVESGGGGPLFYKTQPFHGYKPYQKPHHPQTAPSHYNLPSSGTQCANDFAQYKEPLIGLEYVTEIQVTGQNPRYHCKLCDAKFDHNVKFPHLVGAKHRFNVLKEKNPAVAQEIRLGVKKRSELTGKLLEEAMKIEQQEGRQQVKTCVEASPFDTDTIITTPGSSVVEGTFPPTTGPVRGRGLSAPSRPYQKFPRGQPSKGITTYPTRGGQKRAYNQMNHQNQFGSPFGYGNNNQGYSNSLNSYETGPPYQGAPVRGRGGFNGRGRGRGRGGPNQSYGRGFNNKQNKQTPSFTSTTTYQQNNPRFNSPNQNNLRPSGTLLPKQAFAPQSPPNRNNFSPSGTLLPRQAFAPRSPPRSQADYSNTSFSQASEIVQSNVKNEFPEVKPQSSQSNNPAASQAGSTSKTSEPTTQNLLKGLTDLGKLVSSEEDASIALQVSNALTQALLQYRMQNLQEEGQK